MRLRRMTRRSTLSLMGFCITTAGGRRPLYFCEAYVRATGWGEDLSEARGPSAYGRAQDQQCAWAGVLLARRMGKQRIIAETGAGQHGVATATVCALLGLECVIYMGEEDMRRQELNVYRMRLLGADVRGGELGVGDTEGRDQRGDAGTGSRTSGRLTTFSGAHLGRIRIRLWCGTFTG